MKNVPFQSKEEALETLRLATEAAALGIWDFDFASGELHLSERARAILSVPAGSRYSYSDFLDGLDPEERESVDTAIQKAFHGAAEGDFECEFRLSLPGGETRWVYAKGKAIFGTEEPASSAIRMIGTLLDRTEQRLAQHALLQAEQLAATGRLAASIAHEINNPLEAVTNLLYLLRDEKDETQRSTYLQQAESELARVSEIASNTLRFYRDPKGITSVEIAELVDSVLHLFQGNVVLKSIDLQLRCERGTRVQAAQGEMRQVFINLIGNAIDAMPNGGRMHIRCRTVRALGNRPNGVGICFADTGTGMSPETQRRIFEPFYTTKGSAGTGLGLWLSKEIIRKHGFRLKLRSKLTRGSVFSIFMPLPATA